MANPASAAGERGGLRIYLDDTRPCPEGWTLCRWPEEVIDLLEQGGVEVISLDHDLGEDSSYANPRTGMDVLNWLEARVARCGMTPPRIWIHTANPVAREQMKRLAYRIIHELPREAPHA